MRGQRQLIAGNVLRLRKGKTYGLPQKTIIEIKDTPRFLLFRGFTVIAQITLAARPMQQHSQLPEDEVVVVGQQTGVVCAAVVVRRVRR